MGEFAIGQSVLRREDPRLLQGRGRFFDDLKLADQLQRPSCARHMAMPTSPASTREHHNAGTQARYAHPHEGSNAEKLSKGRD
jgi:hypothetical protein